MARTSLCIAAFAAFSALNATAQTPVADEAARIFKPADFERFSPRTALDMVREIPGFQIEGTDGGRGLGQASGNVLINGERLSGKSNSPRDALGRISAGRVERIEVRDALALGIPGLSGQVVNVITSAGELSGVWEWDGRVREGLEPRLNAGELSLSASRGNFDWTVGLEADANRFRNEGEILRTGVDGALLERRDEEIQGASEGLEGTLALTWAPPSGHLANFNASYAVQNFNRKQDGVREAAGATPFFREFLRGEDEWNSEISGDYALPALGGQLKLIGLHRHEDSRLDAARTSIDLGTGAFIDGVALRDDFIENEAIGRVEFDWSPREAHDWQIAGEVAYNRLDAGSSFFTLSADGEETLDGRAPPSLIEETRYDISLTHLRPVIAKWTLQASLGAEYSEISSQLGADSRAQDFVRPKGYVGLTYQPTDDTAIELRIERQVGQLNFFDFVASQDLNEGNDDAANRNLVPDQTWRFEASYDLNLGDLGAVEITAFHEEIEDLIDRIPLPGGGDAPGNIDSANRSRIEGSLTLNLDRFGFEGVQFDIECEARLSEVRDPVTGETRRISGRGQGFVFAELRWDIPRTDYALLIAGERFRQGRNFRLDEINRGDQSKPFVWLEAEHKDLLGTTAYIRLGNLLNTQDTGDRLIFSPDRSGDFIARQGGELDFGYILSFGLSGTF